MPFSLWSYTVITNNNIKDSHVCLEFVFHLVACVGHQSVQSQVQPKYQHDQKVHRSAHRQAVH